MHERGTLAHLVIAVLAVQNYSPERAWDLLPALEQQGLLVPETVAGLDQGQLVVRLARAGYNRGPVLTTMIAERAAAVCAAATAGRVQEIADLVRSGQLDEARNVAFAIRGVGPRVFEQFLVLEKS